MTIRMGLTKWVAGALPIWGVAAAVAAPVSGQGDWETYFVGRDANGNAVPMVVGGAPNPSLTFVYDTQYNLTWLADWNVNRVSLFGSSSALNGAMIWDYAMSWADSLSLTVDGVTVDDWRLPRVVDIPPAGCIEYAASGSDCGWNVLTASGSTIYSEYALVWYTRLGNIAEISPSGSSAPAGWGLSNTGPFSSMETSRWYFSGSRSADSSSFAFGMNLTGGMQAAISTVAYAYAVPVREGDVLVGSVPEPVTLSMLLAGLGMLGWASGWAPKTGRARHGTR